MGLTSTGNLAHAAAVARTGRPPVVKDGTQVTIIVPASGVRRADALAKARKIHRAAVWRACIEAGLQVLEKR